MKEKKPVPTRRVLCISCNKYFVRPDNEDGNRDEMAHLDACLKKERNTLERRSSTLDQKNLE